MTREDHLKFCKTCVNRKPDFKQGLICNLTGNIADFNNECEFYEKDLTPPPPPKNNVGFDIKNITAKFTVENSKKILLSLIPLVLALVIYRLLGITRQTIWGILSIILIGISWGVFFSVLKGIFFPNNKTKKLILLLSVLCIIPTTIVFDNIFYGDEINTILSNLNEESPKTSTVILEKEFRDAYIIKRKEIAAKWIYSYQIEIENKIIDCQFSSTKDLYKVGDSIIVAYDKKTPEISKILKKAN
ncbi:MULTISPECIES: hypothetical protein [Cellulophaga]|uniref:DUF3592 domain-containing protein n=2 Tax=Cellulophaga TaxID=104264 RepID=F0RBX2_CELLC|nr:MULTISPECIES: hypothetical protein [Cellulophaga]ADY29606.1 hypothetical protein Celly_1783 [Cellulophaga lytica DSM 7489]APU10487.1 hypothetical protein A5M85_09395 [Cellulophaga lytica]EWH12496.1 hypothetical protein KLA_14628 [Cellulophaga geojensis KL-A]WQG76221.1 hypothetical protein SR888_11065 [Cellulophaga lytica]